MGKFIISKRSNGEYQFNLKADNEEIVLTSEGYKTKDGCKKGIESVRVNSQDDSNFDRRESTNNKYYFNLKAGNREVIGTSQLYTDLGSLEKGIKSVKTNAPSATIVDQS